MTQHRQEVILPAILLRQLLHLATHGFFFPGVLRGFQSAGVLVSLVIADQPRLPTQIDEDPPWRAALPAVEV